MLWFIYVKFFHMLAVVRNQSEKKENIWKVLHSLLLCQDFLTKGLNEIQEAK